MSVETADWDRYEINARGSLGFRGAVHPDRCPINNEMCDDCPWFMGHKIQAASAYIGDTAPFCCGYILRGGIPATPQGERW